MDPSGGGGGANAAVPWRRQGSQGSGSNPSSPAPQSGPPPPPPPPPMMAPTGGPPPPPPPMAPSGGIPTVRLNSEIGPRENKGPPMALAGAMMKDKKPFTYTPGGIDLSEIRSPRMAKRIQVNAAAEGVSSTPTHQTYAPGGGPQGGGQGHCGGPPPPPPFLPPAAMAAMNPSMAIPVLPQGGFNPQQLNRTQKPSDFVRQEHEQQYFQQPLQPSLPQQLQQQIQQRAQQQQSHPHAQHFASQPQYHHPQPQYQHQGQPAPHYDENRFRSGTVGQNTIRPPSAEPQQRRSPSPTPLPVTGTGSIYIAPVKASSPSPQAPTQNRMNVAQPVSPSSHQQASRGEQNPGEDSRRANLSKMGAKSQNLGSIYIPPIEQRPSVFTDRDRNPNAYNPNLNLGASSPSTAGSESPTKTPQTPQTPQLNKAPTPWMNSYNKSQKQGPPEAVVTPSANVTPWGASLSRNIPISIVRDDDNNEPNGESGERSPYGREIPINRDAERQPWSQQQQRQNQPGGPRVIPIQIERGNSPPSSFGGRNIPIQIEGTAKRGQVPTTPTQANRPNPYNSPMSTYSPAKDTYQRQASELSAGMDKLSAGDESPRMEPIQSKSFKVIQKIADDVDEGSLHKTSEPRFRGGHIPSRAFRALQNNLPASPGSEDNGASTRIQEEASSSGGVTHHIPIRFVSPPPSGGGGRPGGGGGSGDQNPGNRVPASQQQVVEPKKYVGGNIPSRSFKILQAMTADDVDSAALGSLTGDDNNAPRQNKKLTSRPPRPPCRSLSSTPVPTSSSSSSAQVTNSRNNNFVRSRTVSPSPTPRQSNVCTCCCNHNNSNNGNNQYSNNNNNSFNTNNGYKKNTYGESDTEDYIGASPRSYSPWPENYDPNYDPFAYMQWYYWWYYNYGYPGMGWNNYDYSQGGYPTPYSQSQTPNPEESASEAETEAETAYKEYYNSQYHEEPAAERHVPRIVIDGSRESPDAYKEREEMSGRKVVQEDYPEEKGSESDYTEDELNGMPRYEADRTRQPYAYDYSGINNSEKGCDSENEKEKSGYVYDESEIIDVRSRINSDRMEESDSTERENTWKFSDLISKEETAPSTKETATVDDSIFDRMTRKFELFENDCPNETEENEDEISVDVEDGSEGSNVGVVEEPDTVSEEDAPTLVAEIADPDYRPYDRGVTIEECYSPTVEEIVEDVGEDYEFLQDNYGRHLATRLSTIEELTERSLQSFSMDPNEASCEDDLTLGEEYAYEDEDDGNTSDEGSSVSVIENKSGDIHNDWGHTTAGESHADEASSSSDADDENDDDPLLPTVTVQLPMKLSFSKSRSCRDITTLMVGNAQLSGGYEYEGRGSGFKPGVENEVVGGDEPEEREMNEEYGKEGAERGMNEEYGEEEGAETEFCIKEDVIVAGDYDEDEPVVSYTISLSRSTSKSCEKNKESDSDCAGDELEADQEDGSRKEEMIEECGGDSEKYSVEDDWSDEPLPVSETTEDDTDFWGEIKKTMPSYEPTARPWRDEKDFWNDSSVGDDTDDNLEENELQAEEEPETCVTVCEVRDGETIEDVEAGIKKEDEDDFWTKLSAEPVGKVKTEDKTADESVNFWDRGRTFEPNRFSRQFSWECNDDDDKILGSVPIAIEILESATESEANEEAEERPDNPGVEADLDFWGHKKILNNERESHESNEEAGKYFPTHKVPDNYEDAANTDDETSMECLEVQEYVPQVAEVEAEVVEELENMEEYEWEAEAVSRIHESETVRALHSHGRDSATYVSDENSDESTCTLADNTKRFTPTESTVGGEGMMANGLNHSEGKYEYNRTHSRTSTEIKESNVEVKETREKFKLGPSTTNHTSLDSEESTTEARPHERMTRAEDLLWRIERFLQESLSLGSEDDSGVMTDISRQLSDVDTDNDVEAEVVMRNNTGGRVANRSLKTRSMIETSTTTTLESYEKVDTSAVVMRNTSAEKKYMRYQRAKTHSRLFQLLQDECSRDEEEADIDFENLEQVEEAIEKSKPFRKNSVANIKESIASKSSEVITESNRSRLVPLPIKDFFGSSSVSVDSTSSSSGVLSPSSPVSRDRLLVDIINQFHQRHQSKTKKKVTNFPSKIFKLLQQEFGEEFYDTFDCCEDDFDCPLSTSLSESADDSEQISSYKMGSRENSNRLNSSTISGDVLLRESCRTPTHSESITADSSSSSCNTSKTDFLEVPQRRKKAVLARDPRVPKQKKSNFENYLPA